MVILGANLGHRLHPLQHYEYKGKNKIKIGLDIVMDYIKVVCKQIYIEMFVSRTKWQMQSGVKSGANTLYIMNDWTASGITADRGGYNMYTYALTIL